MEHVKPHKYGIITSVMYTNPSFRILVHICAVGYAVFIYFLPDTK